MYIFVRQNALSEPALSDNFFIHIAQQRSVQIDATFTRGNDFFPNLSCTAYTFSKRQLFLHFAMSAMTMIRAMTVMAIVIIKMKFVMKKCTQSSHGQQDIYNLIGTPVFIAAKQDKQHVMYVSS